MSNSLQKPVVGILMGSASDLEVMLKAKEVFDQFSVSAEVRVLSAHRTPESTIQYALKAKEAGIKVIIAAAGLAAHLAGVTAAHTLLPVVGVPMDGGPLNGIDALLSTVQMPKGIPVASMAIGKAGAINAALFAVRILALSDEMLFEKLCDYQKKMAQEVLDADASICV